MNSVDEIIYVELDIPELAVSLVDSDEIELYELAWVKPELVRSVTDEVEVDSSVAVELVWLESDVASCVVILVVLSVGFVSVLILSDVKVELSKFKVIVVSE